MWLIEGYIAIKRDVLGIIGNLYAKIVELQMHMCLEWMVRGKMILKSPIEGEGGNPLCGLCGKRVTSHLQEIMTDRQPTQRLIAQPTNGRTDRVIGKFPLHIPASFLQPNHIIAENKIQYVRRIPSVSDFYVHI